MSRQLTLAQQTRKATFLNQTVRWSLAVGLVAATAIFGADTLFPDWTLPAQVGWLLGSWLLGS